MWSVVQVEAEERKVKLIRTVEASTYLVALDYCDGDTPAEVAMPREMRVA